MAPPTTMIALKASIYLLILFYLIKDNFVTVHAITRLYVDQSGQNGSFTTVQAAIDAVPENNLNWVIIHIKEGIYRGKVTIIYSKPYIVLKGKGKKKTVIESGHHDTLQSSCTFTSYADYIVVKSLSFRNTYNLSVKPVPAAYIGGDKSYFYRVGFYGFQDTLWDDVGRHYFRKCTIQGAIDFIFGNGTSIYEESVISVIGDRINPGFITAQGRESPYLSSGYVFKKCRVDGPGAAMLGRAWRSYARVLFSHCYFSDAVVPPGWNAWNYTGQEYQLTFADHECYGPGANKTGWVSWEAKLSPHEMKELTSMDFIQASGWLYTDPYQKY